MGYERMIAFAGGALASGVLGVLARQPQVRKMVVACVAQGMQFKAETDEMLQSIKDEAEDVCADARIQARIDAAVAARRAELEEEIRAEVEAELDKELAAIEAEALADGKDK